MKARLAFVLGLLLATAACGYFGDSRQSAVAPETGGESVQPPADSLASPATPVKGQEAVSTTNGKVPSGQQPAVSVSSHSSAVREKPANATVSPATTPAKPMRKEPAPVAEKAPNAESDRVEEPAFSVEASSPAEVEPASASDWEPLTQEEQQAQPVEPVVVASNPPAVVVPPSPPRWGADERDDSVAEPDRPVLQPEVETRAPIAESKPADVFVPPGTIFDVRLAERLSTRINQSGDTFRVLLDQDLRVGDRIVIPKGTEMTGELVEVVEPGKVKGRAKLSFRLVEVELGNDRFKLETNTVEVEAAGTKGKDLAKVGTSAAIGAALGAIFGGKRGAVVGGTTGAGTGTAGVLLSKGDDLDLERERLFSFRLENDLILPAVR